LKFAACNLQFPPWLVRILLENRPPRVLECIDERTEQQVKSGKGAWRPSPAVAGLQIRIPCGITPRQRAVNRHKPQYRQEMQLRLSVLSGKPPHAPRDF